MYYLTNFTISTVLMRAALMIYSMHKVALCVSLMSKHLVNSVVLLTAKINDCKILIHVVILSMLKLGENIFKINQDLI